jgi:hypothetical protein
MCFLAIEAVEVESRGQCCCSCQGFRILALAPLMMRRIRGHACR